VHKVRAKYARGQRLTLILPFISQNKRVFGAILLNVFMCFLGKAIGQFSRKPEAKGFYKLNKMVKNLVKKTINIELRE
jgi:hypothetical protein